MHFIEENLKQVEQRIREACARSGRRREDVRLIVVSKTKPVSMIEEVIRLGIRDFGENKPQELRDKYDVLPKDLRWHMIGNLQRNKIKYVVGRAAMIHSIGSEELALAVDRECEKKGMVMPCLVEVNMAHEESKGGIAPEEAPAFVRSISVLKHLKIEGLMTVAPYVENPGENRGYFRALRNLAVDIDRENIDNIRMRHLSMGMTGDFEVAVEEGATMIRVGTGILGERNYSL
jgi:pyridoxal phosphate enzyme (YggS family)